MRTTLHILIIILLTGNTAIAQNITDTAGKKQGPWTRRYPNGKLMYEGTFKDDQPVGLFRRYTDEGELLAELNYIENTDEAEALFFYPDGSRAAEGRYLLRAREGRWKFWSATQPHYLISEEEYTNDVRDGTALKYFPDGTLAEKVAWDQGKCTGEWLQYYPDGTIFLRAEYIGGKLEGPFSYYHPNGQLYSEGLYSENMKDGEWMVFNEDGSLKQIITYSNGVAADPLLAEQETKFLDELEKKKGTIEVTDITGAVIR